MVLALQDGKMLPEFVPTQPPLPPKSPGDRWDFFPNGSLNVDQFVCEHGVVSFPADKVKAGLCSDFVSVSNLFVTGDYDVFCGCVFHRGPGNVTKGARLVLFLEWAGCRYAVNHPDGQVLPPHIIAQELSLDFVK